MQFRRNFAILALICCVFVPFSTWSQQYEPESSFTVRTIDSGKGIEITDYIGTNQDVHIPPQIRGLPVTSIAGAVFDETTDSMSSFALKNLISVTIPNSVTSIGDRAFAMNQLTSVTIPNSVTSIGEGAFANNQLLTSVTIPDNVVSIGDGVFSYCTSLTSITIPNSVTSIGKEAFSGCTGLTSVTIPSSVTSIGDSAFWGCISLTINVDAANATYSSENGIVYNKSKTSLVIFPASKSGAFTIPSGIISIGNSAFGGCKNLSRITIPSSITSIGDSAFWGCTGLTSVTFAGIISSGSFSTSAPFHGDLRAKFFATNASIGTPGTYTTRNPGLTPVWTRQ